MGIIGKMCVWCVRKVTTLGSPGAVNFVVLRIVLIVTRQMIVFV